MKRYPYSVILIAVAMPLAAFAEDKTVPEDARRPAAQSTEKIRSEKVTLAPAKSETAGTNSSIDASCPVICFIEKQDRTITVKAGPKGTVYSVKTRDGKALCENVSLDQLRAQAPELHDFIKSAIVLKSDKSEKAGKSDASLRIGAIR